MSLYAVVENGVVTNVVVWDGEGEWSPASGEAIKTDSPVAIGWNYSNGVFSNPNAPQSPTKSEMYESELAQINNQYAIDKAKLADAYLNAGLFDGASEATKKAAIYAQLQITNTKYFEDLDTLDEKYGV